MAASAWIEMHCSIIIKELLKLKGYFFRSTLCTKRVSGEYKLTPEAYEWILGEIETRFQQAQVSLVYYINIPLL